jgi:cytochrome oxidase Cu insertion factor (SCO1/SenC/PrrC family)
MPRFKARIKEQIMRSMSWMWMGLLAVSLAAGCNRGTDEDAADSGRSSTGGLLPLPDAPPAATQPATGGAAAIPAGLKRTPFLTPEQRDEPFDLNFAMLDQDGREVNLNSFVGKPIAMSFMFTRCPDPNMCPLITARMAELYGELGQHELASDVHLLLISYDPHHDSPQRLKAYGQRFGIPDDRVRLLVVKNADDMAWLVKALGLNVEYHSTGFLKHFIELLLIDRQGRFVRDYRAAVWSNDLVVTDLQKLLAE